MIHEELIARLLAMGDAVFAPVRTWNGTEQNTAYMRRSRFLKAGLPWRSLADDEADRKQAQRDLEAVVVSGLAEVSKPSKGRTLGARLTDQGDAVARALCGVPGIDAGVETCHEVYRLQNHPGTSAETGSMWRGYVPETLLAGVEYGSPNASVEFAIVESVAAVALLRGWIEWAADIQGRVWYRLTDAGLQIATGKMEPPEEPKRLPEFSQVASTAYHTQFHISRFWLSTDRVEKPSELGAIPLPVSMKRK